VKMIVRKILKTDMESSILRKTLTKDIL
jgi:hypothetical protein